MCCSPWGLKESDITWRLNNKFQEEVGASQVALVVKNPPANAEDLRGVGSSWEDPLEEGMAAHSSILAWRIPRTEKPGRLWFMGSQGVRQVSTDA